MNDYLQDTFDRAEFVRDFRLGPKNESYTPEQVITILGEIITDLKPHVQVSKKLTAHQAMVQQYLGKAKDRLLWLQQNDPDASKRAPVQAEIGVLEKVLADLRHVVLK